MKALLREAMPLRAVEGMRRLAERFDPFAVLCYSQEGEDQILRRLFESRSNGFYVDVGAHHPQRFSNTFHFYRRGWSGINIEPNPDAIALFQRHRPRDINLCVGIANRDGSMPYYVFDEPALNTFDRALSEHRIVNTAYKLVAEKQIKVRPLAAILADNLGGHSVDFMSVDVEGFDLEVLQSNDWNRFRPTYLLVESRDADLANLSADPVQTFALAEGYRLIAKTVSTLIYQDSSR